MPAVAVRSSATAEDLPEASFAGQQDSYLNVRGEDALLDAVRRCWGSLWTARAIAYRARRAIDPSAVALAVVVQRMVQADTAGILFTLNPVTGATDEMIINVSWGLGEAIVGGRVSPDTVIVDRATGHVRRVDLGDKAMMTATTDGGTADVAVPAELRTRRAIDDDEAAELGRLGREVEALFGSPQDVEWAIADGCVWVLQARPVTATATAVTSIPGDDEWPADGQRDHNAFDLWTQADVGERWPEPVTPLTWSTWLPITNQNMRYAFRHVRKAYLDRVQWAARFQGRVYLNEGAIAHVVAEEYGLPGSMAGDAIGSDHNVIGAASEKVRLGRLLRALPTMSWVSLARMRNERRYQRRFDEIDRWSAQFDAGRMARFDDDILADELDRVWLPRLEETIDLHADISSTASIELPILQKIVARWGVDPSLVQEAIGGMSDVRQAEMVPALVALTRELQRLGLEHVLLGSDPRAALAQLRADPGAAEFNCRFDRFLAEHGHRCAIEAEWRYARWAEAPEQLIATIAGYVRLGDQLDPEAAASRQRERRDAAIARIEASLGRFQRRVFRGLLRRTVHVVRLRDNGQHYVVKLALPVRRIFAEFGERWASRGLLITADDIFFLSIGEIRVLARAADQASIAGELRATVQQRRRAYEHWLTVPVVESFDAAGRPIESATHDSADALTGIPASAGRVTGVARVVATMQDAARLQPGDVLVTRATDPGWTPIFPLVAAVVLEIGGQLSHGAIVAREYGIPAVVNVVDAMRLIPDGSTITVDGATGRVMLEPAIATPAASN